MATPFFGQIICKNIPNSKTVRRFIEKRIHRWMLRNVSNPNTPFPGSIRYFVALQREAEGHGVNCRIEIYNGKKFWRSVEYASGLHQALIRGINHLIPSQPPQFA